MNTNALTTSFDWNAERKTSTQLVRFNSLAEANYNYSLDALVLNAAGTTNVALLNQYYSQMTSIQYWNYTNAWFVGYTPTLSTAVWMGHAEGQADTSSTRLTNIPFAGYTVGEVFGGTIPAATWRNYMLSALKGIPPTDFSQPAPLNQNLTPEQVQAQQHPGLDLPNQSPVDQTGTGGPYQLQPPPAVADVPTTTSTSTTSTVPSSTTSTSAPP